MKLGVPKERKIKENRVALTPDVVKQLVAKGYECVVEKGAGESAYFLDEAYTAAGATILESSDAVFSSSDVVMGVNSPDAVQIAKMKKGAILISFMYAISTPEIVTACVSAGISAFSVDAIPRISRAQKMDALSSQANLAGYKSVILVPTI